MDWLRDMNGALGDALGDAVGDALGDALNDALGARDAALAALGRG